eukprot:6200225-Pleurochrysis_carterae.AAC.1
MSATCCSRPSTQYRCLFPGFGVSVFKRSLNKLNQLLRGTINPDRPQDAGEPAQQAPLRRENQNVPGIVYDLELPSAAHLVVDIWDQNYLNFQMAMCKPSKYGGFSQPHLRHEICVYAWADTLFYQRAHADPWAQLPSYFE